MTAAPQTDELPASLFEAAVEVADPVALEPLVEGLTEFHLQPPTATVRVWSDGHGRAVAATEHGGTFEILGGRRIVCRRGPTSTPSQMRAGLHSVVASLVLEQQGRYALHASTVTIDDVTVAIAGRRGAGKSTTSLALAGRGALPVVDDITVLDLDGDRVVTRSFGRPVHVFWHVVDQLGIDLGRTRELGTEREKLAIDWPEAGPTPVDVVLLLRRDPVEHPVVERLQGMAAAMALRSVTHLGRLAEHHDAAALFAWFSTVASCAKVVLLQIPTEGWPLDDHCERVERITAEIGAGR